MEFRNVQNLVEEPYRKLGFYDQWRLKKLNDIIDEVNILIGERVIADSFLGMLKMLKSDLDVLMDVAEVGLFGEEVGELLDAIRKGARLTVPKEDVHKIPSQGEECADLVIRIMGYCNRKKINLEEEILKKHDYNMQRSWKHNKRA